MVSLFFGTSGDCGASGALVSGDLIGGGSGALVSNFNLFVS